MNELFENKLIWVVLILCAMGVLVIGGNFVVDKVADRVIIKLQKGYAPGPYAPGFDPDRVDPNLWRQQQPQIQPPRYATKIWEETWEEQRR